MKASTTIALPEVQIPREVPTTKYRFADYFKGFEKVPAVQEIFGEGTQKILNSLQVEFSVPASVSWESAMKMGTC